MFKKPSAITQAIDVVQKVQMNESFTNSPSLNQMTHSNSRFGNFESSPRTVTNEVNYFLFTLRSYYYYMLNICLSLFMLQLINIFIFLS